jgi:hypothetical protein
MKGQINIQAGLWVEEEMTNKPHEEEKIIHDFKNCICTLKTHLYKIVM